MSLLFFYAPIILYSFIQAKLPILLNDVPLNGLHLYPDLL